MRFVVDEQLPPLLARWLRSKGHEADHVFYVHLLRSSHELIARRTLETGAVVVTKDKDYDLWRVRLAGLQVLWLRLPNGANRALLARLEDVWPEILGRLQAGESLVVVTPTNVTNVVSVP